MQRNTHTFHIKIYVPYCFASQWYEAITIAFFDWTLIML